MDKTNLTDEAKESALNWLKECEHDSSLSSALYFEFLGRRDYRAALFFAKLWAEQQPDSFMPYHALYSALIMDGKKEEAWRLLISLDSLFNEDALYIIDKLLYLFHYSGKSDARRYVQETTASKANGLPAYLSVEADIYESEHNIEKLKPILHRLAEDHGDKKALFKLGVLYMMSQNYREAADCFKQVINIEKATQVYFLALFMDAICTYTTKEPEWEHHVVEVAEQLEKWANTSIQLMPLRELSIPLWQLVNNTEKATENRDFMEVFEQFLTAPSVLDFFSSPEGTSKQ